jgi:drug/metabolite transporter (DMT)-like permease
MIGKGEAFAILSALAWAFGVILYKRLGERLPPLALNLRKNGLVLLALVPLLLAFHGFEPPALSAMEVAICLASGLLGIGIADTLYFRALNQVGAARMGIVGNFYSPFVIVLAFAFLGERLTGMQLLGFVLVSAGVLVIGAAKGPAVDAAALRRGLAIGVLAVLLMAVAIVMVKRVLEHADLLWVSTIRMLGGVAGMLVIGAFLGGARAPVALDGRGWAMLVAAALIGQLLSMLLWLAGYKYTSASVAAILNETASVFIVVLAWVFLGERLTRRKAVGIGCTLGGVALMLVPGGH